MAWLSAKLKGQHFKLPYDFLAGSLDQITAIFNLRMKDKINSILAKGKTKKKNKKVERYINYAVLTGVGFMLFWIRFLLPPSFY